MARSEYSTLRGIAQKRLERLQEAGIAPQITLPKSRDLTPEQKAQYVKELQSFLSGKTTVREARKEPGILIMPGKKGIPEQTTEKALKERQRRERRAAYQREYRRRKVLEEIEDDYPEGLQHIANAEKIGLHIETRNLKSFVEYVEFRLDAAVSSMYYRVMEDFAKIQDKAGRRSVGDVRGDFARYLDDRTDLQNTLEQYETRSGNMTYNATEFDAVWDAYIDEL